MKRTLAIEHREHQGGNDEVIVEDAPLLWDVLEDVTCWVAHKSPLKVFFWTDSLWTWVSQEVDRRTIEIIRFPVDCGDCVSVALWPSNRPCNQHPKGES